MDDIETLKAENAELRHAVLKWQHATNRMTNTAQQWKDIALRRQRETARALRQHDGCDHALAVANDKIEALQALIDELKKDP